MVFTSHCNNCGIQIIWWNPKTGKPQLHPKTNKKMPFTPEGDLHKCMKKGQDHYFQNGKYMRSDDGGKEGKGYFYTLDDY